jgi:hypothetical protein
MLSARFRVTLLPLALLCIVVGTMVPFELRAPLGWDGRVRVRDFLDNLVLFAPLGVALHRQRWWVIAGVAGAVSGLAEILQIWHVSRFPSPYDVISNVLGAVFAARLYPRRQSLPTPVSIPANGWWLLSASVFAALILTLWHWPRPSTALASWDPEYPLLVGNERTQDQPWHGTLANLTLLQRSLSSAEVHDLGRKSFDAPARYGAYVIYSDAGQRQLNGTAYELPREAARRMVSSVATNNAFTVIARIGATDLTQASPARIVSFSQDLDHRNFDLSQEGDRLSFRVRNAVSGVNGQDFHIETPAALRTGTEVLVVAAYDGTVARVYLDGALHAVGNYVAWGCPLPAVCDSLLPLSWSLIGGIAALLALTLTLSVWPTKPRKLPSRITAAAICVLGGVLAELLLPPIPGTHEWQRYLAWLGALTVGMSAMLEPLPSTLHSMRRPDELQPVSRSREAD